MKILLDCSPAKIVVYRDRYADLIESERERSGLDLWQLRTPLTNYALAPEPIEWAADNGFFSEQDADEWLRWIDRFDENRQRRPLFVTLPDIVCDAPRTLELFEYFKLRTNELPRALVIQNGIEYTKIPWPDLDAIFIGGDDAFKSSPVAIRVAKTAKILKRWVHVGRVNTASRVRNWIGLADSIDGSGISRYDHMLEDVLAQITGKHPQHALELAHA